MVCTIRLEQISSSPPFASGGLPQTLEVYGRASNDCSSVRVSIAVAGPGSPTITNAVVPIGFPPDPGSDLPGLFVYRVALPGQLGLQCGDTLHVEAICIDDPQCRDVRDMVIDCKPAPAGGGGGTGTNGGWSPTRCFWTGVSAAMTLLAALVTLGIGIALMVPVTNAAAIVLFGIAAAAWALWAFWCGPGTCVRLAVLCWVFKRALILSIPTLGFTLSALVILLLVGYGSIAGILVDRLRRMGCPIPSALQPLTQIPL